MISKLKNNQLIFMVMYLLSFWVIAGCGSSKPIESKPPDIDHHGHKKNPAPKEVGKHDDKHKHDHGHEAPNGGALVELGEEFAHLELVNDVANNKIICYVLDGDLKAGVKAQQPSIIAAIKGLDESHNLTFKATVSELSNNTAETSSQYESEFKFEKGKKVTLVIKKVTLKNKVFENVEATLIEIK